MEPVTIMLMVACGVVIVVAVMKRLLWLAVLALAVLVLHQLGIWEQFTGIVTGFLVDGPLPTPTFLLPFLPGQG